MVAAVLHVSGSAVSGILMVVVLVVFVLAAAKKSEE